MKTLRGRKIELSEITVRLHYAQMSNSILKDEPKRYIELSDVLKSMVWLHSVVTKP